MKYLPLIFLIGCASSSPLPKVQHVSQSIANTAVAVCLEAHQVNEQVNPDPVKQKSVEATIDSICEPVLDGLDALTAAAASDMVAKMYSDLAKVLGK